jgi:heat shock protein HslJ
MNLISTKALYILLGTLLAIGVTVFALFSNQEDEAVQEKNTYSYTTSSGKKVLVRTEKSATSSRALITTEGFETNVPTVVEKETLSDVFFTDLNGDTFEELVLVFTPNLAGGNGDISVFTTFYDTELTTVELPEVGELDKAPGMFFEGYVGGDVFLVEENILFRNFLVEDTSSIVTQGEEEPIEEDILADLATSSSEEVPPQPEILTPTKQKRISYALVSSEGLFYLEPREAESAKVFTASSTATLANTSWAWLSVNYDGSVTSSDISHPLIFSFREDSTFSASSSCEIFTGSYILSGYLLRLGSITSESVNEDPTCKSQTQLLKDTLPLSETFVIRDGQLMINLEENKGVVLFIRQ